MSLYSRKTEFGTRLKALRTAHNLTHGDLSRYATILNEYSISTGSISWWENGKRVANIESARLLADIFGVSLNWLLAKEDEELEMYDETRLEILENNFLSRKNQIVIRDSAYPYPFYEKFPEDYLNLESRKAIYQMPVRANIVFLMYVIDFEWERYIKFNASEFKAEGESMSLKDYGWLGFDWFLSAVPDEDALKQYVEKLVEIFETKKRVYRVRW